MSAGFTPGPWRVSLNPNNFSIFGTNGRVAYTAISQRSNLAATGLANARLIAAAPELYAALDSAPLPSTLGNREEHYQRFYDWYNNIASPALAKARGDA